MSKEWRLFIDSSTSSLKAVLFRNGNKLPTISLNEDYNSVKFPYNLFNTPNTIRKSLGTSELYFFRLDFKEDSSSTNVFFFGTAELPQNT